MKRRSLLKAAGVGGLTSLTTVFGGLLTGCKQHPPTQQINFGIDNRVQNLDPRFATDALSSRINRLIYRQLIDFNEASEPIPDLASWQQISPTEYKFILTEHPQFHHGKPLEAADVVATYQSVLQEKSGSPHRGTLLNIQKVEALSSSEISFKLKEPDALFVGRLSLGILPADLIKLEHNFFQNPIGSGWAKFVESNEQRLVLLREDGVQLRFIIVKDALVRVLKLQKGELDLVQNDLSPELVAYCAKQDYLEVDWQKGSSFGYLGYNFADPLLADLRLRQAVALGIDRQEIIQAIFSGEARLAGGLLPPEHWAGNEALQGWEFNPQEAKRLVEAVKQDFNLDNLELSFKTSSDPTRIRLATIYQSQLKKIGIDLKIQSYDWGTFYNDIVKGRFQLFSLAWVGIKSPDIFQYVFASDAIPPKGANRGRYQSELADELINRAGQTPDLTEQARIYKELQAYLQQDLAVMPLWFENQYLVRRKEITGFSIASDGRFDSLIAVNKR